MIARGRVESTVGGMLVARLAGAAIGAYVRIGRHLSGEIRRIDRGLAHIAPHGAIDGIGVGTDVCSDASAGRLALGTCALGRAIDARGNPLDGEARLYGRSVALDLVAPEQRAPVTAPLWSGIRAIDALLTLGVGSRTGLFGPPGAGKSTLLEMLAAGAAPDAIVVALIGERGREAQSWIARRDCRTTVICATSDRPAAERVSAVRVALAHASALRSRGLDVLLLLDSLARTANSLRELAVATGESTGRGGYPPSVFAELARMVEVCGATPSGSITLVATVLEDGDERDPVSDAARSLLDGHLQLSAALVRAGRFPAVDIPASASRTMASVAATRHLEAAGVVRRAVAELAHCEDARSLGLAVEGAFVRAAIRCEPELETFLRQSASATDAAETLASLEVLAAKLQQ